MFTEEEEIILNCEDIITIGDLTMSTAGTREYIPEVKSKYKFIDDRIMLPECPQERLMLRPKQSWLIQNARD